MSYSYSAYFTEQSDANLAALAENLKKRDFFGSDTEITLCENEIEIVFDGTFGMGVIDSGKSDKVHQEAIESAKHFTTNFAQEPYDKEMLIRCKQRFEIISADDIMMDYFNHCVFIIEELEKFKEIFIFLND